LRFGGRQLRVRAVRMDVVEMFAKPLEHGIDLPFV
jgi:hypothetical protein